MAINTRRQNYFIGVLGEKIIANMFKVTTRGCRSFDLRVLTEKRPAVGHRLECKTRKIRKDGTFQVNFTRFERTHSDTVVILVLDDNLETERLYWVPTFLMPRDKGYLYFPKGGNPKYEAYRLK